MRFHFARRIKSLYSFLHLTKSIQAQLSAFMQKISHVQARIDASQFKAAKKIMIDCDISWQHFIESALANFIKNKGAIGVDFRDTAWKKKRSI